MHSAFVWACSNNDSMLGGVAALVNPRTNPNALPDLFWKHLEKDLEGICAILKRGEDESILVMHLVLKEILTRQLHPRKFGILLSTIMPLQLIYRHGN